MKTPIKPHLMWFFYISVFTSCCLQSLPGSAQPRPWMPPSGLEIKANGTGRTTGHIATLTIVNTSEEPQVLRFGNFFIPSLGQDQSYVVPETQEVVVPAQGTATADVMGYCADIRRPPVGNGVPMPAPSTWLVPQVSNNPDGPPSFPVYLNAVRVINRNPGQPYIDNVPVGAIDIGSDQAIVVDPDKDPGQAASFLLDAVNRIGFIYDEMQADGDIKTPFSNNLPKEREAVIQQTLWMYGAALKGESYDVEEFSEQLAKQYENKTGIPIASAPEEEQEKFEGGVDDFWNTFTAVGVEAKVISASQTDDAKVSSGTAVKGVSEGVKSATGTAASDANNPNEDRNPSSSTETDESKSCECGDLFMRIRVKKPDDTYDRIFEVDYEAGSNELNMVNWIDATAANLDVGDEIEFELSDISFDCKCEQSGPCDTYTPRRFLSSEIHKNAEKGSHGIHVGDGGFNIVKNNADNTKVTAKTRNRNSDFEGTGTRRSMRFVVHQICKTDDCDATQCMVYVEVGI